MRIGRLDVEGHTCNAAAAASLLVSDNILFFLGLPRGGLARKTCGWSRSSLREQLQRAVIS